MSKAPKLGKIVHDRDNEYTMLGNTTWVTIGKVSLKIDRMGDHVMIQACKLGDEFNTTLNSMAVKQPGSLGGA